jgi:phosphohistidine phosphatase
MRLGIMRHAEASMDASAARDFDRALNERGRRAAERMGRELVQRGFHFDHVLASPARRVRETLDCLSAGYGALPVIRFEDILYGAGEGHLLAAIKALPEDVRAPLIVGHNPGLHSLVFGLAGDGDHRLRTSIAAGFPAAAFAAIQFAKPQWSEVAPGAGHLCAVVLPRELD